MENSLDEDKTRLENEDIWQQIRNINIETDKDTEIVISVLKKLLSEEQITTNDTRSLLNSLGIEMERFDETTIKYLNKLSEIQYQVGSSNCHRRSILSNHINRRTKQLNEQRCEKKLQLAIKSLSQSIDKVQKLTNKYNTDLQELSDLHQLLEINKDEQEEFSRKLKLYTAALKKLESQHPEFTSSDYNLTKYQLEIDKLEQLRKQKKVLDSKLSKYHGVSTDLNIVRKDVENIESEYKLLQNRLI